MKLFKQTCYLLALLLLFSNSSFADGNFSNYPNNYTGILNSSTQNPTLFTTIQYDDSTGAVMNSSTTNLKTGLSSNNMLGLPTFSMEQIAQLQALEAQLSNGPVPEGYATFDEFKADMIGKFMRGELPDGYSSWQEYIDYLSNSTQTNTTAVPSTTGGVSGSNNSSVILQNPKYKKAQDALLTMPIAVQTAGYMNQLLSYDEAFHNMDMQMMMPYKARMAYRFANKYAVVENYEHIPTNYQPNIIYSHISRKGGESGLWVRPYASFGSINFKNGPKADNNMYGAYIGGDSSFISLKHSDFQYSIYAGYNGTHQTYGDNSIYSNGGLIGATGAWYGENAFAAITVNAGATNAQIGTSFMNKDYPLFSTGVAAKAGYNFEFADGKFIIQPSYLMSYSFVTPFEKGKVYGFDIQSKPMNVMNISPGIKFIGNLKHGWQPYAEARMIWSLFDKTSYSTAYIDVPSISLKPYAQYGIGIQKLWGERSTGYIQFMMRSGGRNEVAFSAGYKCALGD